MKSRHIIYTFYVVFISIMIFISCSQSSPSAPSSGGGTGTEPQPSQTMTWTPNFTATITRTFTTFEPTATVTLTLMPAGADTYESDNSPGTANLIGNGETQTHSIHLWDDEDWMYFDLPSESCVSITTADTNYAYIEVFEEADTVNSSFTGGDGTSPSEIIDYCFVPAGRYYIHIRPWNYDTISQYRITLNFASMVSDTETYTATPTITATFSFTQTVTNTVSLTITNTNTATSTGTPADTYTATPTITVTRTASPTVTVTNSSTPTVTVTSTCTITKTHTITATPTVTATSTATPHWTQVISSAFTDSNYPVIFEVPGTGVKYGFLSGTVPNQYLYINDTSTGAQPLTYTVGARWAAADSLGNEYITYADTSGIVKVLKNGSQLGPDVSSTTGRQPNIYIDNDIPYVAYIDGSVSSRISVKYYSGGTWQYYGTQGFSNKSAPEYNWNSSLYIDGYNDGTLNLFVAYADADGNSKLAVMKNSGSGWAAFGPGFASQYGAVYSIGLSALDATHVYTVSSNTNNHTVYAGIGDGSRWDVWGTGTITNGYYANSILAAAQDNVYYAGGDNSLVNKCNVQNFNGTSWSKTSTTALSSGGVYRGTTMVNFNSTLYLGFIDVGDSYRFKMYKYE